MKGEVRGMKEALTRVFGATSVFQQVYCEQTFDPSISCDQSTSIFVHTITMGTLTIPLIHVQ